MRVFDGRRSSQVVEKAEAQSKAAAHELHLRQQQLEVDGKEQSAALRIQEKELSERRRQVQEQAGEVQAERARVDAEARRLAEVQHEVCRGCKHDWWGRKQDKPGMD